MCDNMSDTSLFEVGTHMTVNLQQIAKEKGIQFFLISFVDLFGVLRSKLVPARAISMMQENGAGFAGFATWLDMTPAYPDMFAVPDPKSLIQLPWKPEVAWLASDLIMNGEPVNESPRVLLKNQINSCAKEGYRIKTGVECEYFLLSEDGSSVSDQNDTQDKPCYDQAALMRRYDVISKICNYMIELGWNPYQNDHEDANGQFEMNWDYDDVLVTADRHVFFKYMVKAVAEEHGFKATFMPKPFTNLTGNGCHAHVSLWDKSGKKNLFDDKKDQHGISPLGYKFLAGVLYSADALAAIFNPTVNSYKRIDSQVTLSGATWSPNAITYGGNNRTHMVRIPEPGRFELRLMDGASNPYLLQAGILASGLDGIINNRNPGKPLDINMYTEGHKVKKVRRLPSNLLDAIRIFQKSKILRSHLGSQFVESYCKLKYQEWRSYSSHLSDWEIKNTMDC